MRIAFVGFRHGHIFSLHKLAARHPDVEIVAACEDHEPTRRELQAKRGVQPTHSDYPRMLAEVRCDVVAVGDYYGRRGEILIAALRAGRHVIADKPICTRAAELEQIAALAAEKHLSVGCQLDMRGSAALRTARRLIAEGAIGEVHTVAFSGQHPLLYGSRPDWYFEEGKHGGTIHDLAIHAVDAIPWMTGRRFVEVVAARVWNARPDVCPRFQDGAQMMLRLDNGGGVLGDVSYLAPDGCGYRLPQYWRLTCHGTEGMIEIALTDGKVHLAGGGDKSLRTIEPDPAVPDGYFAAFLREVRGEAGEISPSTQDVLAATRITLAIQQAADENRCHVAL